MERAVALEPTPTILPDSLPEQLSAVRPVENAQVPPTIDDFPDGGFDLEQHIETITRDNIERALRQTGGVKVKAAELLGMTFRSFRYYTKKYNLK
jgi:two-component system response regulator PilR (NtrC family)